MPSPKVWLKFSSKKFDGSVINFRIQDAPANRYEDVLDFVMAYYVPEEAFQRAAGIYNNPIAIEESRLIINESIKEPTANIVICCLDDGSDKIGDIIGLSMMTLLFKEENDLEQTILTSIKSKEAKKVMEILTGLAKMHNTADNYDKYYEGRGIITHPDYRGLGIATKFIKARRMICKEQGVPMTMAWMTSLGTQKAAERDSWQTALEVSYVDMESKFGVTFEHAPSHCKLMFTTVD